MRLLLVEDNQADVFLVHDAMKHEGVEAEIQVANDGECAITLIEQHDLDWLKPLFDCMLIDINLPRRSGAEVLSTVRRSTRLAKSPVIMMTSSEATAEHQRMLELGATDIFVKPFLLSEFRALVQLIQRTCDQSRSDRELS